MPTKREEATHDCKKDCELLHKEIAALKKEVTLLKTELKKAPKGGGGSDPRVDLLVKWLINRHANNTSDEDEKIVQDILSKLK
jgi:hypothetical protein